MDLEKEKFINDALASDHFDTQMEIRIREKVGQMLKRYGWVSKTIGVLLVIILALAGFQIKDIYSIRDDMVKDADQLQQRYIELMRQFNGFSEEVKESRKMLENFRQPFEESLRTDRAQFASFLSGANDSLAKGYVFVNSLRAERDKLESKMITLDSTQKVIKSLISEWTKKESTIVRYASTIYAYVERGGREGSWDYHPKLYDLPFSRTGEKAKIMFTDVWSKEDTVRLDGRNQKYKMVTIKILVTDSAKKEVFSGGLDLREYMPRDIKGTNYQVELLYVYDPRNVIGLAWPGVNILHDFVILAISLKDPKLFTAEQTAGK
jgi:hypothetical protein